MTLHSRREILAILGVSASAAMAAPVGFAFGTYGMKTVPTSDALRELARIGYDGVELSLRPGWPADPARLSSSDRRRIREQLLETRLALPAVLDELPLLGTPASRVFNSERLKLAAGFAHDVAPGDVPCLDTILGLKSADWETANSRMVEELSAWARIAESESLTVGVKPHAGQAMDTPEKAVWIMHQVNSPRIRLIYDYSHIAVGGFPLESSLRSLLPYAAFISVKDARGTPDSFQFLLPGDGTTDYAAYFKLLRELNYHGYVSVEVSAMIFNKPGYDPFSAARTCYERLAPKFREAGLRRPSRA